MTIYRGYKIELIGASYWTATESDEEVAGPFASEQDARDWLDKYLATE